MNISRYKRSKVCRVLIWALIAGHLSWPSIANGETEHPELEYQIKASLLFNFLQFVEWPPYSGNNLAICIVGQDRFGNALAPLKDELVRGKQIVLQRPETNTIKDLQKCQVLFVGLSDTSVVRKILSDVSETSLLTVGETKDFLELGGIISFVVDSNKIVFEVNRVAAKRARLEISSKLLRLASRVQE